MELRLNSKADLMREFEEQGGYVSPALSSDFQDWLMSIVCDTRKIINQFQNLAIKEDYDFSDCKNIFDVYCNNIGRAPDAKTLRKG